MKLKIGGLQKATLIDYPGKVACVIFLAECNFRCPYCHNPELVHGGKSDHLSTAAVFDFLKRRRGFLDAVVLSGGEPTLCPNLPALCKALKQMGYWVKLDTNGSRPERVKHLIAEGLVDYIAVDVKTDGRRYRRLTREIGVQVAVAASIGAVLSSGIPHEFRTTCVTPFIDDRAVETIAHAIQGARLLVLQRFVNKKVLDPTFFEHSNHPPAADTLKRWQALAAGRVMRCIIR